MAWPSTGPNDLQELRWPRTLRYDAVPVSKAVLAAGAVLWRPSDDGVGAGSRGHPPAPLRRLVTAQGQGRPRRDRTRHRRAGGTRGDRLLARTSADGSPSVSYPVDQGVKKVRYWAARSVDGEFTPNDEVDELQVAARRGGDEATGVSARPEGVAPLRQTTRRHQDVADRSARHGGQQVPVQGRRPKAAAGQARPRSGRVAGRTAARVRRRRRSTRPTECAATRRSSRWPKSSASPSTTSRLLTEEAYADEPQSRPAPHPRDRRRRRHAGDLHTGQGDSRSDRVVVRARRRAPRQVAQPQGQHVGDVVGRRRAWSPPTTSAARWPPRNDAADESNSRSTMTRARSPTTRGAFMTQ